MDTGIKSIRQLFHSGNILLLCFCCLMGNLFASETGNSDVEPLSFDMLSIGVIVVFGAAVIGIIVWLLTSMSRQNEQMNYELNAFANQTLSQQNLSGAESGQVGPPIILSLPESENEAKTDSNQGTPMSTTLNSTMKEESELRRAGAVLAKLEQANQVKLYEGTLNVGQGEKVLMLEMMDGKRAIIFDSMPQPDLLTKQLKRCDLIFVALDDSESVCIEGFGNFIAKRFSL